MDPIAAKQFFISRVLEEADRAGVPMSTVEKRMLSFSEVNPSPDAYEINEQFERDYDSDEYEAKVVGLLKRAWHRDQKVTGMQTWDEALRALRNEDHYILVMLYGAFPRHRKMLRPTHRVRDYVIYITIGIGIVILSVVAAILIH